MILGSKNTPAPLSVTKGAQFIGYGSHSSTDVKITVGGLAVESDKVGYTSKKTGGPEVGTTGRLREYAAKAAGVDGNVPKFSAKVEVGRESAIALGRKNNGGNTEFIVEAQTKVTGSISAAAGGSKGGSVEIGGGLGFKSAYQVTLPGENQSVAAAVRVNPFNPTTIPVGGRVTLNGEAFAETSLAASFRFIGMETKTEQGKRASYVVERVDQNTVRVMMGRPSRSRRGAASACASMPTCR